MSKEFTMAEVAKHRSDDSLYLVIDGDVYDVTNFVNEHPGGAKILKRVSGKDASKQFWKYHNEGVLKKYKPQLAIGTVKAEAKL
ncbi:cytochrome b5 [Ascodesmis nigricans]|uniref:Cytochrome b5 n=1 Tax=Ascodesmis nigricans TaxID=341454 RepID=A0A4S2MXN3_9PEZI|nr:cytochrome b5 [Ascodesmis nigricans]